MVILEDPCPKRRGDILDLILSVFNKNKLPRI